MVKILFSVIVAAVAVEDEVTSLLQVSAAQSHQVSKGQLILAAVSKDGSKDTICVKAAAGDVAPIIGSFTAQLSQQAVEVAVGSVAQEAGSFCVPTQDVLLLQRTLGLATAQDFEAALGRKGETAATTPKGETAATTQTTTTTTEKYLRFNSSNDNYATWPFGATDWDVADFDVERTVRFAVKECPSERTGLLQTMDAAVSKKKNTALTTGQMRVCNCRTSLEATSKGMWNYLDTPAGAEDLKVLIAADASQDLLQSLDGALSSKKGRSKEEKYMLAFNYVTCQQADQIGNPVTYEDVARGLNNPAWKAFRTKAKLDGADADPSYCDKYWAVMGACSEILKEPDMLIGDGMNTATHHSISKAARLFYTQ